MTSLIISLLIISLKDIHDKAQISYNIQIYYLYGERDTKNVSFFFYKNIVY